MLHIIGQKKYNWDLLKWRFDVIVGQNFWDSQYWTHCRLIIGKPWNLFAFFSVYRNALTDDSKEEDGESKELTKQLQKLDIGE